MILPYLLTPAHRLRLARAFRTVPRVDLSIECVIEGQMGSAFVDDVDSPRVYKISTGPFAYFAGDPHAAAAPELLGSLAPGTLLMPSATGWAEAGQALLGERLVEAERYQFSPDGLAQEALAGLLASSRHAAQVRRMDMAFVEAVWGQDSFVDVALFDSPADFVERGIGYYLERGGRTVGAAFSSLVCSRGIEISIYVVERYRGAGMATALAAQLLLWCLDNGAEPHWDAANPASCRLAARLGYLPLGPYRAYYVAA